MSERDLPSSLHAWLTQEMRFTPPPGKVIPSSDDIRGICRGPMVDVWKFILEHVYSVQTVKTVKGNLALHDRKQHRSYRGKGGNSAQSEEEDVLCQRQTKYTREVTLCQADIRHLEKDIERLQREIADTERSYRAGCEDMRTCQRRAALLRVYSKQMKEKVAQYQEFHKRLENKFHALVKRSIGGAGSYKSSEGERGLESVSHRQVRETCDSIGTFLQETLQGSFAGDRQYLCSIQSKMPKRRKKTKIEAILKRKKNPLLIKYEQDVKKAQRKDSSQERGHIPTETHPQGSTPTETHPQGSTPTETHLQGSTPTETHPQGSTTSTETHPQGSTTHTETHPQGSTTSTETHPQGSTTSTETHPQGSTPTETHPQGSHETHPQGSTTPTETHPQGSTPTETHPQGSTPTEMHPQGSTTPTETHPQGSTPTETHPQGSTTSTETHPQGSTTSTETHPQGSTTPTETHPQGSTPTETHPQGSTTSTETHPQGSTTSTETHPQGSTTHTETHPQGSTPTETHPQGSTPTERYPLRSTPTETYPLRSTPTETYPLISTEGSGGSCDSEGSCSVNSDYVPNSSSDEEMSDVDELHFHKPKNLPFPKDIETLRSTPTETHPQGSTPTETHPQGSTPTETYPLRSPTETYPQGSTPTETHPQGSTPTETYPLRSPTETYPQGSTPTETHPQGSTPTETYPLRSPTETHPQGSTPTETHPQGSTPTETYPLISTEGSCDSEGSCSGNSDYVPNSSSDEEMSDVYELQFPALKVSEKEPCKSKILDSKNPQIFVQKYIKEANLSSKHGRTYDRRHACFFCEKMMTNIQTHYQLSHKNKEEVKEIMDLKRKIAETKDNDAFKNLLHKKQTLLRNKGNHRHNTEVSENKSGEIILARRKDSDEFDLSLYGPCPFCQEWIILDHTSKHQTTCPGRVSPAHEDYTKGSIILQAKIMKGQINSQASKQLKKEVFSCMRRDGLTDLAQNDSLIVSLGDVWLMKNIGNRLRRKNFTSFRMRLCAKLLQLCREETQETEASINDFIKPCHFDTLVKCALKACKETVNEELLNPSTAIKMGYDLSRLASLKLGFSIKKSNEEGQKQASDFLKLLSMEWGVRVNKIARVTLEERHFNKPKNLPFPKDIVRLSKFLVKTLKRINLSEPNEEIFRRVTVYSEARLLLYNRRRPGELESLSVDAYRNRSSLDEADIAMRQSLTEFEQKLLDSQDLVEIRGKTGRGVPLLIPQEVKRMLEFLSDADCREKGGIKPENGFMFGNKGDGVIRAGDALNEVKQHPDLKLEEPSRILATNLRKYTATIAQVLNLNEQEMKWVCNHLGHTMKVHDHYYRQTSGSIERIDIAKMLLLQENNMISKYSNKKLSDVQMDDIIQDIEDSHETSQETSQPSSKRSDYNQDGYNFGEQPLEGMLDEPGRPKGKAKSIFPHQVTCSDRKQSLWSQVETTLSDLPVTNLVDSLVNNTQTSASTLREKTMAINIRKDAENLRFKFEEVGQLRDMSVSTPLLMSVHHRLEESQLSHIQAFMRTEQHLNAAAHTQQDMKEETKRLNKLLASVFTDKPGEMQLAQRVIEGERGVVSSQAALHCLLDTKDRLQEDIEDARKIREKMYLAYKKIHDFQEIADSKQNLIRVLSKQNLNARSRLDAQQLEIMQYIQRSLTSHLVEVKATCSSLDGCIVKEMEKFSSLMLPYLLHVYLDGTSKVGLLSLSIHQATHPSNTAVRQALINTLDTLNFPPYKGPECTLQHCMDLMGELQLATQLTKSLEMADKRAKQTSGTSGIDVLEDITELRGSVTEQDRKLVERVLPVLNKRLAQAGNGLANCLSAQASLKDWWEQPAQSCAPWVKVDNESYKDWLDKWKVIVTRLVQIQVQK